MKKMFIAMSFFCCSLLLGSPQEFLSQVRQSALTTLQTDPALQTVNIAAVTACITSLFNTGYVELTNDPNHTIADITLGLLEKTFGDMARQNQIGAILGTYLHPLPDLSLRVNGYTPNLSSPLLTPEKAIALSWRASTIKSMLDAPNAWVEIKYSGEDFQTFSADPANRVQLENYRAVLAHYVQMRADAANVAPTPNLEGTVFKVRDMSGMFYTFTTNIPDQTKEAPTSVKLWLLFPYSDPQVNRAEQYNGAAHATSIQRF